MDNPCLGKRRREFFVFIDRCRTNKYWLASRVRLFDALDDGLHLTALILENKVVVVLALCQACVGTGMTSSLYTE